MNGNILYLDGACGISGDMTVAALLDLGGSRSKLDEALSSLNLEHFSYSVSRRESGGIAGCSFDVHLDEPEHHHHHHEHRNLSDVYTVIDRGDMTERACELAKKTFRIVAEAEAEAHGCAVDEVHFHEVGAVDSIADIVAAAVLADDLGIGECAVATLSEGGGLVHCQHGDLPVPVPAVLNIARAHRIALHLTETPGEMITPTGIALAAALRTTDRIPPVFTVEKIGIGVGKRDFGRANVLRAMLVSVPQKMGDQIYLLEANIDDCTGEELALAMEKIFSSGARDVHFMPCFMKKNRPGYLLRVVVAEEKLKAAEQAVFEHTTTIGLRRIPVERTCLERRQVQVQLPIGVVEVKKCFNADLVRYYPEFESVKKLSESSGIDFRTIFDQAGNEAKKQNV